MLEFSRFYLSQSFLSNDSGARVMLTSLGRLSVVTFAFSNSAAHRCNDWYYFPNFPLMKFSFKPIRYTEFHFLIRIVKRKIQQCTLLGSGSKWDNGLYDTVGNFRTSLFSDTIFFEKLKEKRKKMKKSIIPKKE